MIAASCGCRPRQLRFDADLGGGDDARASTQIARAYGGDEEAPLDAAAAWPGVEEVLSASSAPPAGRSRAWRPRLEQIGVFRGMPLCRPARRCSTRWSTRYSAGETGAAIPSETRLGERRSSTRIAMALERDALPPELYEALLTRRNRAWTDWLIARLDRPGTVLFAVGAGHLAGRVSVQSMLAGRGFTARRIG